MDASQMRRLIRIDINQVQRTVDSDCQVVLRSLLCASANFFFRIDSIQQNTMTLRNNAGFVTLEDGGGPAGDSITLERALRTPSLQMLLALVCKRKEEKKKKKKRRRE